MKITETCAHSLARAEAQADGMRRMLFYVEGIPRKRLHNLILKIALKQMLTVKYEQTAVKQN